MRSRVVREPFWTDSRLGRVSTDARLLFLGLWGIMDRCGRLEGDPLRIRVQVFPYDAQIDVEALLAELGSEQLIRGYTVEGRQYIEVLEPPRWTYFYEMEKPSILPAHGKQAPSFPEASGEQAPSVEPEPKPKPARNQKPLGPVGQSTPPYVSPLNDDAPMLP